MWDTKPCSKCKEVKRLPDFKKKKDGYRTICKLCVNVARKDKQELLKQTDPETYAAKRLKKSDASAAWWANNKAYKKVARKKYYDKLRETEKGMSLVILQRAKYRARRLKIEFDLTQGSIIVPKTCPVLGIPLFFGRPGKNGPLPNSPSLDRIDPTKGYVRGNVRVISNRANTLKCDASLEELELVLQDLRGLRVKIPSMFSPEHG